MNNAEKTRERHQLAFKVTRILNKLEICVSKLRTGFLDNNDFCETKKTIKRLQMEIAEVDTDIVENLDKEA